MATAFIRYAVRSDKGCVRKNNEDNLFFCGRHLVSGDLIHPFSAEGECALPAVFGVFDGVGGEQYGEWASMIAAQSLADCHLQISSEPASAFEKIMKSYTSTVNCKIAKAASAQGARMGTTAAVAIISQNGISAYNIGDSRIYMYNCGKLRQISVDHTLARQKIELKEYTVQEARRSRDWGKLTACLGIPKINGEFAEMTPLPTIPVKGRIRLLLCSDGVSDMVPDNVIAGILRFGSPGQAGKKLMSEVLNRGGQDNASFIIADITSGQTLFSRLIHT